MRIVDRRLFLKKSLIAGAGLTALSANYARTIFSQPTGTRTNKKFGFSVLCEDYLMGKRLYSGYDEVYVPISIMIKPLEPDNLWQETKDAILSWNFPVRNTSHFAETVLPVVGPDADFELATIYVRRAMARCAELGIKICGVFGGYFDNPSGDKKSMIKVTDQTMRFINMCADEAAPYGIKIALESCGSENNVFPLYLDSVEFAKRLGRENVRCMADSGYFITKNQNFDDIGKYPEYLIAAEMQGINGQPGIGNRKAADYRFFRVLRDVGWEGVVNFANPWVYPTYGIADFTHSSRISLEYVKRIQDDVYAE